MDSDSIARALREGKLEKAVIGGGAADGRLWRELASSPWQGETIRDIRAEGERLLAAPTPELTYELFAIYRTRGTRLEYERVYFERRRRLNTFALLTLLEPERADYRAAANDIVWSVCNEYTWCLPAHVKASSASIRAEIDLFAAETGFALTEIAALLGDRLPPLLRERIAEEVEARLFRPYMAGEPYGWETARHNWAAVCAGSVGAAALIAIREPERLAPMLAKAIGSIDCFLDGYGDDGACLEGLGYWNYGFGYFVYFADLLLRRTNGTIDLLAADKVKRIALFQQKAYLDGDRIANFSDSTPAASVQIGLTHYLGGRFANGGMAMPPLRLRAAYTEDHCSRWAHAVRNLLWFAPQLAAESGSDAGAGSGAADQWPSADYYMPNAQWIVSRLVGRSGRFGFAAKGGHNDEPHNHNDVGHFILMADGETFAADLGSGEYTQDYFGAGRYGYDCNGAQGHSVPIVDGRLQQEGAECAARVLEASIGDEQSRFAIEMAAAYDMPELISLVRTFVWRKPETESPALTLTDEFRFAASGEHRVAERVVTPLEPSLEEAGSVKLTSASGRAMRIRYDAERLVPAFERRTDRDHFGEERTWYAIDFGCAAEGDAMRVELHFQLEEALG